MGEVLTAVKNVSDAMKFMSLRCGAKALTEWDAHCGRRLSIKISDICIVDI